MDGPLGSKHDPSSEGLRSAARHLFNMVHSNLVDDVTHRATLAHHPSKHVKFMNVSAMKRVWHLALLLILIAAWRAQLCWRSAECYKGRGCVYRRASLLVPARYVERAYGQLADAGCTPRRWHPEGRYGLPIKTAEDSRKRLIPLLADAVARPGKMLQQVWRVM